VIDGTTAFTKSGDGILALSGTNTYTGTTTISGGQINILS
jgi:fibronectin-binding autotransporter adhesin